MKARATVRAVGAKPALLVLRSLTAVVARSISTECAGMLAAKAYPWAIAWAAVCAVAAKTAFIVIGGWTTIVALTVAGMRAHVATGKTFVSHLRAGTTTVTAVSVPGTESKLRMSATIIADAITGKLTGVCAGGVQQHSGSIPNRAT